MNEVSNQGYHGETFVPYLLFFIKLTLAAMTFITVIVRVTITLAQLIRQSFNEKENKDAYDDY